MKKRYIIILASFLVLTGAFLLYTFYPTHNPSKPDLSGKGQQLEGSQNGSEPMEPYVSPIDFPAMQGKNGDLFAWLDIPGTEISYPLLQSAENDTFYLDHDQDGKYSGVGALFTEHFYNSTSMLDPVTVVYGHHMNNGSMFGNLQKIFSDPEQFQELRTIVVYLPDGELHYNVRAAVPYDNRHILHTYDFNDEEQYRNFLYSIYHVRALGANYTKDEITTEDTLLVLSTCLKGNRQNRYLVLATLDAHNSTFGTSIKNDQGGQKG